MQGRYRAWPCEIPMLWEWVRHSLSGDRVGRELLGFCGFLVWSPSSYQLFRRIWFNLNDRTGTEVPISSLHHSGRRTTSRDGPHVDDVYLIEGLRLSCCLSGTHVLFWLLEASWGQKTAYLFPFSGESDLARIGEIPSMRLLSTAWAKASIHHRPSIPVRGRILCSTTLRCSVGVFSPPRFLPEPLAVTVYEHQKSVRLADMLYQLQLDCHYQIDLTGFKVTVSAEHERHGLLLASRSLTSALLFVESVQ
ncbi:hypothetical protein P280DRAFT_192402 [Massarina eburnea CBS 473.64]|uniref:Uncharacterized protein n=1 Tax=Massarina eburnea CBS 473.64 TaxID=1395130 RepID=A0A6A6RJX3_9PLEO|nr:hypothetical protein P280DRAFT_192402 [Massarina eburnea CBS 473.64]